METVNLKLAQQLQKAGFPQESYFSWVKYDEFYTEYTLELTSRYAHKRVPETFAWYAAPTADEIIKQLPIRVVPFKRHNGQEHMYHDLQIGRNLYYYEIDYRNEYEFPTGCFNKSYFKYGMQNKVLANVCAEMWLYLKKEGYFDENKEHALFVDKSYDRRVKP